jgi:hypothetical protein
MRCEATTENDKRQIGTMAADDLGTERHGISEARLYFLSGRLQARHYIQQNRFIDHRAEDGKRQLVGVNCSCAGSKQTSSAGAV